MQNPAEIVRSFYERLGAGDVAGVLDLIAADIEWTTMWHYKVTGPGLVGIVDGIFKPLMAEWSQHSLVPTELIVDGDTVVSLGDFTGRHATTGKEARARYAHVWTIKNGQIARFRQYIDTLAVEGARS
jgi:ketosteroid isomerase-like protein